MTEKTKRCMVCGKPYEGSGSICKGCEDSIRGEAVGKRKKVAKKAKKEISRHGQEIPSKT